MELTEHFTRTGLTLPALRGQQGGRIFYLTLPTNSVLGTFFPIDIEPDGDRSQRSLDLRHAREISEYVLNNQDGYALGAVTYAIDTDGVFEEVAPGTNIGTLLLPLDLRLRSIDGQHRKEGIRIAMETLRELALDSTAALLYVEPNLTRRRQMFSDMNNTSKRVSKAVSISFDSRDPFARAVNELTETHQLLRDRVEKTSIRVGSGSGKLFTLGAIHDAVKRLFVGPNGRVKDPYKYSYDEIMNRATAFFDLLDQARPELADNSRTSLLNSSTTLRVVAGAVWKASYEDSGPQLTGIHLAGTLSTVNFEPTNEIWIKSGFVSRGSSTPNARSQEVLAATDTLFKHLSTTHRKSEGGSNVDWV